MITLFKYTKVNFTVKVISIIYIIKYPNGRQVAYYNYSYFRAWRPSEDDLKELSSGPIYVNKSAGIYSDFYLPYIDGVPMPVIESVPIYAY